MNYHTSDSYHETVLVKEVIDGLHIKKAQKYIDATLGNGGHSIEIIKAGGRVLGIDMDPEMIKITESRILNLESSKNFEAINGNFTEIDKIVKENNWTPVFGILFDLGVTNLHLKSLERGFSFENPEAVLDMRLDSKSQGVKACDLLNVLRADQLEELFKVVLEPGPARWITKKVIEKRNNNSIRTVGNLLEICEGLKTGKSGIHEATLPFLALRIAVNNELDNLKIGLEKAYEVLEKLGRLVVISFHSGEDDIVKDFFKSMNLKNGSKVITYKSISAGEEELQINRRSRSARLRVLEK